MARETITSEGERAAIKAQVARDAVRAALADKANPNRLHELRERARAAGDAAGLGEVSVKRKLGADASRPKVATVADIIREEAEVLARRRAKMVR